MSEQTGTSQSAHTGTVVAVEANTAVVQFERSSMCSKCGACLAIGEKQMETRVKNTLHAAVGDRVTVELAPNKIVRASLLAYCVPLAALILGLSVGSRFSDLWAAMLGLGLCAAAFLLLRLIEPKLKKREAFLPKMTSVLPPE